MESDYVTEHHSKTAAVIISAHLGFFFSMLLSMYGIIYLLCPGGDEKIAIVLVGIISSMMSIACLTLFWKYRHITPSSRIFQEQYLCFISDMMVSVGLVVFMFQTSPTVCWETYFHIIKGLQILRCCSSAVMLGWCMYVCVRIFCEHTTENQELVGLDTVV